MKKLIIIRGPSGSGKSTAAKALKDAAKSKTALIDQDYYRVNMLTMSEKTPGAGKEMLFSDIKIALKHGFDVIADGIFTAESYKKLFDELFTETKSKTYIFWFDLDFEETVQRHESRDKKSEFGKEAMRNWYKKPKAMGYDFEYQIPNDYSKQEIIKFIQKVTGI